MAPRFAQLTYSSLDHGSGQAGGWQVTDTGGELTADEQEVLTARIATQFDWPVPIPAFPSPEEAAALPHRLVHGPAPGGATAYWHTSPAGLDPTGRPGNVFAHVLLDRDPRSTQLPLRPADLTPAACWLRPFGQQDVQAATLLDRPIPVESTATLRTRDLHPLLFHGDRRRTLCVLVDAVHRAMCGGKPVVLAVTDPGTDASALWVAAVSRLMSPGASRRFFWSTLERASTVRRTEAGELHLAVIPVSDVPAVRPDVVVVAADDRPVPGTLGGAPHRTSRGSEVEVTAWGEIARSILEHDAGDAVEAMARMDRLAATAGDVDLAPGWPLARAALDLPDAPTRLVRLAEELAFEVAPSRFLDDPELHGPLLARLDREVGPGTEAALDAALAAASAAVDAPRTALATMLYLHRALDDPDWLSRTGAVPVVPGARIGRSGALLERAERALVAAAREPRPGVPALRLLDLVARSGLLPKVGQPAGQLGARLARELLDPGHGPQIVGSAGPPAKGTVEVLHPAVSRLLAARSDPTGGSPAPAVLDWWSAAGPPTPPGPEVTWSASPQDPLLVELAMRSLTARRDPVLPGVALRELLDRAHRGEDVGRVLRRLEAGPPLPARELEIALTRAHADEALWPFVTRTLLSASNGRPTLALAWAVTRSPIPSEALVMGAAWLRATAHSWWKRPDAASLPAALLGTAGQLVGATGRFDAGLVETLLAAHVVRELRNDPVPPHATTHRRLLAAARDLTRTSDRPAELVNDCLDADLLTATNVVEAALLAIPDAPWKRLGRPRFFHLNEFQHHDGTRFVPLLAEVVRARLRRRPGAAAAIGGEVRSLITRWRADLDTDRRESAPATAWEDATRDWWTSVGGRMRDLPATHRSSPFRRG